MNNQSIGSVEQLIAMVRNDYDASRAKARPWFRGEPANSRTELKPKLYRPPHKKLNELQLLRQFRNRAPLLTNPAIPQGGHTDQWLFLAQHVGLPTRLLDWTEGLLVALYFALNHSHKGAVVWMLNPVALNTLSTNRQDTTIDDPLTWFAPELSPGTWMRGLLQPDARIHAREMIAKGKKPKIDFAANFVEQLQSFTPGPNYGNINIRAAWEANEKLATKFPVAVHPTYIHPRITLQSSRFTIWGRDKRSLSRMTDSSSNILKKYEIDTQCRKQMNTTLRLLGISRLSLFPDLDSLATDLTGGL